MPANKAALQRPMLKVRCGRFSLSAKGHAGYSAGEDIVCAAASILFYTLASRICALDSEGKLESRFTELKKGRSEIRCMPKSGFEQEISVVFTDITEGLKLLAGEYPENVAVTEVIT